MSDKFIPTNEWLNAFGSIRDSKLIQVRGNKIIFFGKKGRQLRCRLNYLARRDGISLRRFIINAIMRGIK